MEIPIRSTESPPQGINRSPSCAYIHYIFTVCSLHPSIWLLCKDPDSVCGQLPVSSKALCAVLANHMLRSNTFYHKWHDPVSHVLPCLQRHSGWVAASSRARWEAGCHVPPPRSLQDAFGCMSGPCGWLDFRMRQGVSRWCVMAIGCISDFWYSAQSDAERRQAEPSVWRQLLAACKTGAAKCYWDESFSMKTSSC